MGVKTSSPIGDEKGIRATGNEGGSRHEGCVSMAVIMHRAFASVGILRLMESVLLDWYLHYVDSHVH